MKTKIKKLTPEQQKEQNKMYQEDDIRQRIENGAIPNNITRIFNIGEGVRMGALSNSTVTEVLYDGRAYWVHYDYMGESYGAPSRKMGNILCAWVDLFPLSSFNDSKRLSTIDDIQIRYYNNDIDSLIHKVYHFGVNFNPDYQRDLVWTQEQKVSLMDSIFNNVEIGKFTFIKHDYSDIPFFYEILDGKQRLSTILEYYEDRFTWKGKRFSELCFQDAHHFKGFPIIQGEVGEITEQQIYRLFIKMNTTGTPVSKEHLERIKSLIK